LKVWQAVAHGADGIVYFRWRVAQRGAELYHSGLLDHGRHPTRGYREAAAIGRDVAGVEALLAGSVPPAEVAMLHDYPSRWALDLQPHNDGLADDGTFRRALLGPYEALWARHVPVHILPARGDDDLGAYRLVVVPAIHLVGPQTAGRLASYVAAGGTLLVTARSGFKDEGGAVPGRPPGHLAELLGVEVEEFDSLPAERGNRVRFVAGPAGATVPVALWCEVLSPTTAEPLAVYEDDYYAGRLAATRRVLGDGQALYVGVLPGPDFYGPLLEWLLPQAGVLPLLPATAPPGVEVAARVGPAGRLLFLLHHEDGTVQVTLPPGCRDALSGEPLAATLSLGPRQVRIVRC
jgi:beta-galactosidase